MFNSRVNLTITKLLYDDEFVDTALSTFNATCTLPTNITYAYQCDIVQKVGNYFIFIKFVFKREIMF